MDKSHLLHNRSRQLSTLALMEKYGVSAKVLGRLSGNFEALNEENAAMDATLAKRSDKVRKRHAEMMNVERRLEAHEMLLPAPFQPENDKMSLTNAEEDSFAVRLQHGERAQVDIEHWTGVIERQRQGSQASSIESVYLAHFFRGLALLYSGKCTNDALQDFQKCVQLKPASCRALYNRGFALRRLRCLEAACGDFQEAIDVTDSDEIRARITDALGLTQKELGEFLKAGKTFQLSKRLRRQLQARQGTKQVPGSLQKRHSSTERRNSLPDTRRTSLSDLTTSLQPSKQQRNQRLAQPNARARGEGGDERRKSGLLQSGHVMQRRLSISDLSHGSSRVMMSIIKAKRKFLKALMSPVAKILLSKDPGKRNVADIRSIDEHMDKVRAVANLHPKLRKRLCQSISYERFQGGKTIYNKGDKPEAVYIILTGFAEVLHRDLRRGETTVVKVLKAGTAFGFLDNPREHENISNARRNAVVAASTVEVLVLSLTPQNINAIEDLQQACLGERFLTLRCSHIFSHLPDSDLHRLSHAGQIVSFLPFTEIVPYGQKMATFYIIKRGTCEVVKPIDNSTARSAEKHATMDMLWQEQFKEVLMNQRMLGEAGFRKKVFKDRTGAMLRAAVATLQPGDVFNEMAALMLQIPTYSPVRIIASTQVEALAFEAAELVPYAEQGLFSGRTTMQLHSSMGTNVPTEKKCGFALQRDAKWERYKAKLCKKLIQPRAGVTLKTSH